MRALKTVFESILSDDKSIELFANRQIVFPQMTSTHQFASPLSPHQGLNMSPNPRSTSFSRNSFPQFIQFERKGKYDGCVSPHAAHEGYDQSEASLARMTSSAHDNCLLSIMFHV